MSVSENNNKENPANNLPKSDSNNIRLVKYEPKYFGGITPDTGILINFEDHSPNAKVISIEGDQGLGKTSLLTGLVTLMGGEVPANAINSQTGKLQEELIFKRVEEPDVDYVVKRNRSATTVTRIEKMADGTLDRSTKKAPVSFLNKLFGRVGISPMVLKVKNGKEQVKWLRDHLRLSAEQLSAENTLKTQYQEKFDERTKVNKEVKDYQATLSVSPYFKWDGENRCYIPTQQQQDDLKLVGENKKSKEQLLNELNEKSTQIGQYRVKESALDTDKETTLPKIQKEIEELEAKLKNKKAELLNVEQRIVDTQKYIDDNATVVKDHQEAQKALANYNDIEEKREKLQSDAQTLNKFNDAFDKQVLLNADLDDLAGQLKKMTANYTPDIDGLEVVVNTGIDSDKAEGLYYKGHSMAELSESELWQLFVQLCVKMGINFVFIENSQSLGTDAIKIINELSKEKGVTVFFTTMRRGQSKITVHFYEEMK